MEKGAHRLPGLILPQVGGANRQEPGELLYIHCIKCAIDWKLWMLFAVQLCVMNYR